MVPTSDKEVENLSVTDSSVYLRKLEKQKNAWNWTEKKTHAAV